MADNSRDWWEKTRNAVHTLATGSGSLAERLKDAWHSSLMRVRLHENVGAELKAKFAPIDDRFREGIANRSEPELQQLAQDMLSLYEAACKAYLFK